jgi:hypothetical protein
MPEADLFLRFVRPFNAAGFRYMIAGSVAVIFYGEPRLTHDVDFVAFLPTPDIRRLREIFPESEFYLPPEDVMLLETSREQRGCFNIIHWPTGFKADIYLTGRDELNAWGFRRKREARFQGETIVLAPPEYVIVRKLEYYREGGSEKHLRDIRSILALSGDLIEEAAVNEWVGRLGLEAHWLEVRSSL